MSGKIDIPAREIGVTRVFAVNLPPEEARRWDDEAGRGDGSLETALGAQSLDHKYVDVIDTEAFRGEGLTKYLIEGIGLTEKSVAHDRARLDALSGYVLVLTSRAFAGAEQTIRPTAVVTLIGTYREPDATPVFTKLTSAAAEGILSSVGDPADAPSAPSSRWGFVAIGLGAVALIAIIAALLRG